MTRVPPDFPRPTVRQPRMEDRKSRLASLARGLSVAALVLLVVSALVMAGSLTDAAPTGLGDVSTMQTLRYGAGGIGIIASGVLAALGLLCGLAGMAPRRRGTNSKNGLVWSCIAVFVVPVVGLGYARPKWHDTRERLRMAICAERIKAIGDSIGMYAAAGPGKPGFPSDFDVLIAEDLLVPSLLHCPSSTAGRACDYLYVPPGPDATDGTFLIAEKQGDHVHPAGRYVLRMDGICAFYSEQDFQEALSRPANRDFADAWRAAGQP